MGWVEATPRQPALGDCGFYHSMELPTYGLVEGAWDLRGRFGDYTGHVDMAGRTVLDVGTASGFLTFEAEQRGAAVTSWDLGGLHDRAWLPTPGDKPFTDPDWRTDKSNMIERLKNSYWLAHQDYGSAARCFYGDVYELHPGFGMFDVVLVGQLLVHVADGVRALAACASVARDRIVITEGGFRDDRPVALFLGRERFSWYHYSTGWYRRLLELCGFQLEAVSWGVYRCRVPGHTGDVELMTVVGRRH